MKKRTNRSVVAEVLVAFSTLPSVDHGQRSLMSTGPTFSDGWHRLR
jgi:hypothetical protein